jgi:hypothetical protein
MKYFPLTSVCFPALSFILTGLFLFMKQPVLSQHPAEIGISVSPGFTAVNFEKALGYSDDYMEDWDQFYIGIAAKGFLPSKGRFQPGAEFGWHKLYYAYYVVPYGSTGPVYREFYVSTLGLMVSGRLTLNGFFATASGGIHIFGDGVALAIGAEAGWKIRVGEKFGIPFSLKVMPVFGDGMPTPICFNAGLTYAF